MPRELFKGGRCRNHGSCSSGEKTAKGKRRSLEAMWRRNSRWRAEQSAGVGCETRGHHHRSAAFLLALSSRVCIQSWRRPQGRG